MIEPYKTYSEDFLKRWNETHWFSADCSHKDQAFYYYEKGELDNSLKEENANNIVLKKIHRDIVKFLPLDILEWLEERETDNWEDNLQEAIMAIGRLKREYLKLKQDR